MNLPEKLFVPALPARACSSRGANAAFSTLVLRLGLFLRALEGDSFANELRILLHPADQRRTTRVLPGEAEKVEAWGVGHSATVAQASVLVEDRKVDPGIVGPVPSRPDDRIYLDIASVFETECPSGGARRVISRGLDPISVSRSFRRRPRRDSTVLWINPVFVSHQKRSRPARRWGSGF